MSHIRTPHSVHVPVFTVEELGFHQCSYSDIKLLFFHSVLGRGGAFHTLKLVPVLQISNCVI